MNIFRVVFVGGLLCAGSLLARCQENKVLPPRGDYRLMFYNVENLFDVVDDPQVNDQEFLPEGKKNWDREKYERKLNNVYRVITAVGEWKVPEIVGLCEIENRGVLEDLLRKTPLKKADYEIIHRDSPDERGIDVALLYDRKAFKPIRYRLVRVDLPGDRARPTRDILYVKGVLGKTDTLHFFVNHWPSRSGGQKESEPRRMAAASVLRGVVDSIFAANSQAKLVIMGDLNDDPGDPSLVESLRSELPEAHAKAGRLYNLSRYLFEEKKLGSLKYKGNWNLFDQIVVSGGMLTAPAGLSCSRESVAILQASFLLKDDEKYMGKQPFRAFEGDRFTGGFSDHLPVYLDLRKPAKKP